MAAEVRPEDSAEISTIASTCDAWGASWTPKDLSASYFEVRNGWPYCTLCRKHLTDGHLMSKNHRYRVEMTEYEKQWYEEEAQKQEAKQREEPAQAAQVAQAAEDTGDYHTPPASWGDASYFEWRDDWRWWCILCSQWSDGCHVQGKRHLRKVAWAEYCNEDEEGLFPAWNRNDGEAIAEEEPEEAIENDEKPKFDPWGSWVQEASSNPPAASASPAEPAEEEVRASGAKISLAQEKLVARPMAEDLPFPWRKVYDDESHSDYYWNPNTNETTWERPDHARSSWS